MTPATDVSSCSHLCMGHTGADGLDMPGMGTELNSDQFQKAAVPVSQDVCVSLPELTGVKCLREPRRWLL